MNTREIAKEVVLFFFSDPMCSEVDKIQAILDRHLEGRVLVPREPTNEQLSGLARSILLWVDMDERKTPDNLRRHLKNCGDEVPDWLDDMLVQIEGSHVMPKGMRAAIIYQAMIAAAEKP